MFEQKENNRNIRLPFGFRDIFPVESHERNTIKRIMSKEFRSWGYGEVKTPVMEYTENISVGAGRDWKDKLINFIDIDGNLISLRADMTIPIARLAGMRLRKGQLPARFCYFSDVFRQAGSQAGDKRVFSQAGLEYLGSKRIMEADAEVMIILIRILRQLGLDDFRVVLGHIGFINGLFDWLGLDGNIREDFKKYIVAKDFVRIESLLKKSDSRKAGIFTGLLQPENDLEKISGIVSDTGEEKVSLAFDYLKGLHGMLEELGLGKYLIFDFSIIRDFDYYTGLLFEVYCRGITGIIGSGGRYDDLIKKFGSDIPATGFAVDIDVLHGALGQKDLASVNKILLMGPGGRGRSGRVIKFADNVRKKGIDVEVIFDDDVGDGSMLAREKKCRFLVGLSEDLSMAVISDLQTSATGKVDTGQFLKEIDKWIKS